MKLAGSQQGRPVSVILKICQIPVKLPVIIENPRRGCILSLSEFFFV